MVALGAILQKARHLLKLSRGDVCSQVGVSQEHLRKVEVGWSRPSADLLTKLFDILDVNEKDQETAWMYLAMSYIPEDVQPFINVSPYRREK